MKAEQEISLRIPIQQRKEFDELYNAYQHMFKLKFSADLSYRSLRSLFPEIHSDIIANALNDEFQFFKRVKKSKAWPKELQPSVLLRPRNIEFDDEYRTATIIYKPRNPIKFRIHPTEKQRELLRNHEFSGARLVKHDNDKFMLHCYIKIPIKFRSADEAFPTTRTIVGVDQNPPTPLFVAVPVDIVAKRIVAKPLFIHEGRIKQQLLRKRRCLADSKRYKKIENRITQYYYEALNKLIEYAKRYSEFVAFEEGLGRIEGFNQNITEWRRSAKRYAYKFRLAKLTPIFIDPAYTTKRCYRCYSKGRIDGQELRCPRCGLRMNKHLNASINIALRAVSQGEESADNI